MTLRFALPVIAFAGLVAALAVGLQRDPSELPSPLIGQPLPAFELPSLTEPSRTVSSAELRGRPALVNVWASWCAACRDEHDFLLRLSANGIIPVYGLNWRDERASALRWLQNLGDPYIASAYDGEGRVGIDLGVYGAPETFLIGPDGTVLHRHVSPLTPEVWAREFEPRLAALEGAGKTARAARPGNE